MNSNSAQPRKRPTIVIETCFTLQANTKHRVTLTSKIPNQRPVLKIVELEVVDQRGVAWLSPIVLSICRHSAPQTAYRSFPPKSHLPSRQHTTQSTKDKL